MKKKVLAVVLALVLIIGVLPMAAFAEECECEITVGAQEGYLALKAADDTSEVFYFDSVDGGWVIRVHDVDDGNYPYLAESDGKVCYSNEPFKWQYDNGALYITTVTEKPSKIAGILSWLLSFGRKKIESEGTITVTNYFYLASLTADTELATKYTAVTLTTYYAGPHIYGTWINCLDGHHKHFCKNCGAAEVEECVYDPETHKCVCGAVDPDMEHPFDINVTETTKLSGFFKLNFKVFAADVVISNTDRNYIIEISTDGGDNWSERSGIASYFFIDSFLIRVTDTDTGVSYLFKYKDGKVVSIFDPDTN